MARVTIIPAIDLLDGRCVRLSQGRYSDVTVYDEDPVRVAKRFTAAGATRIHLVDLDAARGSGDNRRVIGRVRTAVDAVLEVGGGVRADGDVEKLVDAGIDRIIVGTVLARDPDLVARWCAARSSDVRFLAGIDAREGRVMVAGWEAGTGMADTELASRAREIGCAAIVYTNISRDGMLEGPDIERTNLMAEAAGLPVVLSGGISSIEDIRRGAAEGHPNLRGIIVGKALYAGRVDLAEAIAAAARITAESGGAGPEREAAAQRESEEVW